MFVLIIEFLLNYVIICVIVFLLNDEFFVDRIVFDFLKFSIDFDI